MLKISAAVCLPAVACRFVVVTRLARTSPRPGHAGFRPLCSRRTDVGAAARSRPEPSLGRCWFGPVAQSDGQHSWRPTVEARRLQASLPPNPNWPRHGPVQPATHGRRTRQRDR
jgi:hypothetical protein